jgi:hypothetical protein
LPWALEIVRRPAKVLLDKAAARDSVAVRADLKVEVAFRYY